MRPFPLFLRGALALALAGLPACGPGARSGYHVENGVVVHYAGFPATRYEMPGADSKTFKAYDREYGRDKDHVYLRRDVIAGADPATFERLSPSHYNRDKAHGYYTNKIISSDGANFRVIPWPRNKQGYASESSNYARDTTTVYHADKALTGVDLDTFEAVAMFNGNVVTRDKAHVYDSDEPIPGADGSSFVKLGSGLYFKDRERVWARVLAKDSAWREIPGADAATFEIVLEQYARDKNHVFYEDRIVDGADVATFKEQGTPEGGGTPHGRDAHRAYHGGRAVPSAPTP